AGDDRSATADGFYSIADDRLLLVDAERGVLAESAEHDESVAAGGEAAFEVPRGCLVVDGAVLVHLGHQGGDHAVKDGSHFVQSCFGEGVVQPPRYAWTIDGSARSLEASPCSRIAPPSRT